MMRVRLEARVQRWGTVLEAVTGSLVGRVTIGSRDFFICICFNGGVFGVRRTYGGATRLEQG